MKFRTVLLVLLLVPLFSGVEAGGQQLDTGRDDFAGGVDDFVPREPDVPIGDLIRDFPSGQATADGAKALSDAQSAPKGVQKASTPDVPEGWSTFEKNGLQVSAPEDWAVVLERDDALAIAKDFDPKKGKGIVISFVPMSERMFERDFNGKSENAGKRNTDATELDQLDVGTGILFRQFEIKSPKPGELGGGYMVVSPWPDDGGEHLSVGMVAMDIDPAPHMELLAKIRQTVRLRDPEVFRAEVIAPNQQANRDEATAKIGLNGLVTYKVAEGWDVLSDDADFLSFRTRPEYSAYVTIGTGHHSKLTNGLSGEFGSTYHTQSAEVFGHSASVYIGATPGAEVMDGHAMVVGDKTLYILDKCHPEIGPIHVTLVGAPKWVRQAGFEALLAELKLALPETSPDCADVETQQLQSVAKTRPEEEAWATYGNARFGTVVDYPQGYLRMMPPPANDDGRTFESADGKVRVLVYGSHNYDDQSLPALMARQIAEGSYQSVASSFFQGDRFEIGGARDGKQVIHVGILDADGVIHTLEISHDPDLSDGRIADLQEMAASFRVEQVSMETTGPETAGPEVAASETAGNAQAMELAFWQSIAGSTDPADFEAYLMQWPEGTFSALARNSLNRLSSATGPAPDPAPAPAAQRAQSSHQQPSDQGVDLSRVHTPQRGSTERAALMDAARIPIGNALGQRVIFVVSVLRTDGNWAFLQATPVQPNGKPVNWLQTPFADEWRADVMSDVIMVLMRKSGGGWQAVDHVIGPTDVHWYAWLDVYGLPEAFFMN